MKAEVVSIEEKYRPRAHHVSLPEAEWVAEERRERLRSAQRWHRFFRFLGKVLDRMLR